MKAIYLDENDTAGQYIADDSAAARYLAHQTAADRVDTNNGGAQSADPDNFDFTGDAKANTVMIEDRSGVKPVTYIWQDFEFVGGKIASWEVQGRLPLDKRLWHAKASDESKGVKATLVSAYESNGGTVRVVVDLASRDRNVRIIVANYTPANGYRQQDGASLESDVDKGGKTLTYFDFDTSHVGGRLKLSVDEIDPDDESSSSSLTTLSLKVT